MGDTYEQLQADKVKLEAAGGHLVKTQLQRVRGVCLPVCSQYLAIAQVEKKLVETKKEFEEEEDK